MTAWVQPRIEANQSNPGQGIVSPVGKKTTRNRVKDEVKDRDLSIAQLVPLVKRVAYNVWRRVPRHIELDELISAGMVGLVEAVDRFDPEKCGSIERYAEIRVRGAILDELRGFDWASRTLRRQASEVQKTVVRLAQELGRTPEAQEVADAMELDIESYHALMKRVRPVLLVPLDSFGFEAGKGPRGHLSSLVNERSLDPASIMERKKLYDLIESELRTMSERERLVVTLYHFQHMTLKQTGVVLGVTESRVSQILTGAVKKLRSRLLARVKGEGVQFDS